MQILGEFGIKTLIFFPKVMIIHFRANERITNRYGIDNDTCHNFMTNIFYSKTPNTMIIS